jgi:hypothetical protein
MICAAITFLSICAGSQLPAEVRPFTVSSCATVMAPLAAQSGYRLSLSESLASRPVVYYFGADEAPLDRLRAVAKALSLEIEIDSQKKLLKLRRSPKALGIDRQERIEGALASLEALVLKYRKLAPKELWSEGDRFDQLSITASHEPPDLSAQYTRKASLLRSLASTRGAILLNALLDAPRGEVCNVLAANCSKANHLALSASGLALLDSYFQGKGIEFTDFADQKRFKKEDWDLRVSLDRSVRSEAMFLGQSRPIPVVTHDLSVQGTVYLALIAITPKQAAPIDGVILDLPPATQSPPETQEAFDDLARVFELKSPFAFQSGATANSLGSAAIALKCNYAGWLALDLLPGIAGTSNSLKNYLGQPWCVLIRARREGHWLQIIDYGNPWPAYVADWRPFDKVKPLVETPMASPGEILKLLDTLSPAEMTSLENVPPDYPLLHDSYFGITGGVRLLRAALRETKADPSNTVNDIDKEIGALTPSARLDAKGFLESSYVWIHLSHLLHPDNAANVLKARLQLKSYEKGGKSFYRCTLRWPEDLIPPGRPRDIHFDIPVSDASMGRE